MPREPIDADVAEMRRYEVVRRVVRGQNIHEIARALGCGVSTVYQDYQHVRLNAQDYVDRFVSDIVPIEIMKCLTRCNIAVDEAMKMYETSSDERVKLQALTEFRKASIDIVNLVTNNKDLVDTVYALTGKGESTTQPTLEAKEIKRQSRLPGSVTKEFQDAIKRQEMAYEAEVEEESEDESRLG
jgi:hypothetical protein